jgi:hypothetical protein
MRFYKQPLGQPRRFYCGVDLHARTMYVCVLDQAGSVVFDANLPAGPDARPPSCILTEASLRRMTSPF